MHRQLIAILRGIRTSEVLAVTESLLDTGITQIEIPLNSPSPFDSLTMMTQEFGHSAILGAGTVLNTDEVDRVHDCGGQLVVSPDCNPDVIKRTKALGMTSSPGVMTPTECFIALRSGADYLKFFPGSVLGAAGLKAIKAVLPTETKIIAVGGSSPDNFKTWALAGACGLGIGSALYKPGDSPTLVRERAKKIVQAFDEAFSCG